MRTDLKIALFALVWFAIGGVCGFFTAKGIYDQPIEEKVERDTLRITDTIPQYFPKPVEVERVKYVTRFMPVVRTDTVNNDVLSFIHDTVAVEVPITSKHYGSDQYDAWVSGFEPSLDSIKVYQRTEYITERVTLSKPPNKWELDAVAGLDYNTALDKYTPYALGELTYKPNRLQFGIHGGVAKTDKVTPIIGIKAKLRIL
jgi:hypothetical protein